LKKRTSINSISDFHKEKEMVDFRKWLMAFAGAALLFGLGSSAHAQSTAFICNATAGNPHIVRSEGVAELVGDLILNCTGGAFTPAGTYIGPATNGGTNVQINLNTNVTSRLTGAAGSPDSEAILSIDEPYPDSGTEVPFPAPPASQAVAGASDIQTGCVADGVSACLNVQSLGWGFGATGTYNGTPGHPNIFQGIVNFSNPYQINWQGVPIDAPGTTITRIIRITNVRANACNLAGNTSSLLPTTITELIGVSGSTSIIINNPLQTVALAEKGLIGSVGAPYGAPTLQQCYSVNTYLLGLTGGSTSTSAIVSLTATEGFAASFKAPVYATSPTVYGQDVLGYSYFTESGWIPPTGITGLDQSGRTIGLADTGTEITFSLSGIGSGVSLFAPNVAFLYSPTGAPTGGYAILQTSAGPTDLNPPAPSVIPTQVSITGTTASVTYQVYDPDPNVVESLTVGLSVAYVNSSSTVPATGTSAVSINFSPLSTAPSASAGPIPRFCQPYTTTPAFTIAPCTCNLLFPFVTNQGGFDTGIAIANTTVDPYGTVAQVGTITLNYYGCTAGSGSTACGPAPALYTTQDVVPAGSELVFTLSSGGGIPGGVQPDVQVPMAAGFEGYIIAQANFQYCHGFAFISDVGAQKLAEGYLAISLDVPVVSVNPALPTGLNRTGNGGESEGH
jgi:hypothetical protein